MATWFKDQDIARLIDSALTDGDEEDDRFQELEEISNKLYTIDAFICDGGGPRYIVINNNTSKNPDNEPDNVAIVADSEKQLMYVFRILERGGIPAIMASKKLAGYLISAVIDGEEVI